MIAIRVVGGLGNQMSQYAVAKSLAIKHNEKVGLDITSLRGESKESHFRRKFKLNLFNIDFEEMSLEKIKKYTWTTGNKYVDDYIIRRFKLFEKNVWRDNGSIKDFNKLPKDIYLDGFFGNPDYFKDLYKTLQKEFVLKDKGSIVNLLKDIGSTDSVSIHVRRGDLLKLKNGYVLPIDYYKKAVEKIKKSVKYPKYYIFSDDIEWCKKNFGNLKDVVFVEGNDVAEDFELMKNCKYNILANSSLSWWVGYLNSKKDSVIIAPKHFGVWKRDSQKNLILKKWIAI